MASSIVIAVAVATALVTFHPRLLRDAPWRATVTPLASIIGSGFLVAGPILAGHWAVAAMAGLCVRKESRRLVRALWPMAAACRLP